MRLAAMRLRSLPALLAFAVVQVTSAPCFAAKPKPKPAKDVPAATPAPPPPPAPAPGPKSLADALSDEPKADYEAGKLLYGDGDYAGARVKFQAAYDLSKDPRLLWNAAACEKGMRHYAKVVDLVKRYLAEGGDIIGSDDRKDAQELLAAIDSFTVGLTIHVNEAGAQVLIDGENVGNSPLPGPVTVDIGTRQIELRKPGFLPFSQAVPVGGSRDAALSVKLEPEVHEGVLDVNAPANAAIFIDGKSVGSGHFSGKLGSGGHTLRVEAPGMRPYQSEVVVQDREKRGIDVVLESATTAPTGAPQEPAGPLHGMELGLRLAYGTAQTKAKGSNDTNYRSETVHFVPVQLDIGYRIGRPTYLGVYAQYGGLDKSETCGIARHGPNPEYPGDPAVRYGYTDCRMLKAGVMLVFHILPKTIVDPYFGFDVGAHGSFTKYRSFDPKTGLTTTGNDNNGSFQPGFQLGIDAHPIPALGAGLFVQGGPDLGGEGQPHDDDNGNQNNGCVTGSNGGQACSNTCSGNSCNNNSDAKVGAHFEFGVRVAYTFP
ncbi:MAG TPA: PEGA domain-containing protein [Polyangiaceae bacterium]|jgi:hypothetical protein